VATQQVSRSWLSVGFSRRRALDLPEFSQIARTQRTRAPVAACLAEHPPLPPRARRGQAFRGPGFRNGSPTRINLHHCLACRRCCGDTSFVSSLLHQFVTSLTGPGASPPSYSPTPLELRIMRNPQGRHRPISLRWPASFRSASGVSVQTQVQPSRAAPVHASRHGIDLSANPGFHRPSDVPPGPACPRRPILAEASSGNGVGGRELQSLFPNLGRCHQAMRLGGYDHPRSVACRASTVRCTRLPQSFTG
jgi:hypothetical protein